ncbi:LOW QUALITY PROTEIN: uncharacterized protein EMH_0040440 [Eimeria mitis]|uniref:Uncharacterized protein n=1 Tax=Eimeria mitis TaxID=44415 RepID=U6JUG8_9EIME|nr:LOW QUALITY PROTEIN: uncharacterized protein EMH_0040440 [Eimeria mitis]CDJ28386.1 hypothetical protein, conserved [Eimeria mitis]
MPNLVASPEFYDDEAVGPFPARFDFWFPVVKAGRRRSCSPLCSRLIGKPWLGAAAVTQISSPCFLFPVLYFVPEVIDNNLRYCLPCAQQPNNCGGADDGGEGAKNSGQQSQDQDGTSTSDGRRVDGAAVAEGQRPPLPPYRYPPLYGAGGPGGPEERRRERRGPRRGPRDRDPSPHGHRNAGEEAGPSHQPAHGPSSPAGAEGGGDAADDSGRRLDDPLEPPPPYEPPEPWRFPIGFPDEPPPPYEPPDAGGRRRRREHRDDQPGPSQDTRRFGLGAMFRRPVYEFPRIKDPRARDDLNNIMVFLKDLKHPHHGHRRGMFTVLFGDFSFTVKVWERNLNNIGGDLEDQLLELVEEFGRQPGFVTRRVNFVTEVDGETLGDVGMQIDGESRPRLEYQRMQNEGPRGWHVIAHNPTARTRQCTGEEKTFRVDKGAKKDGIRTVPLRLQF